LLIYGKKGCLVANIPGKNILNKGQAFPLESSFLPLKNLDTVPELGFVDVQFSILNSNYVLALTSDSKFYAISLLNDLRFDHWELGLDLTPPHSPYKIPAKLNFASFSQSSSSEDLGLSLFQILFLTLQGEVYTLCPLILDEMMFTKDTYDLMMVKLEESAPRLHSVFQQCN
jgi:hypothetical protein